MNSELALKAYWRPEQIHRTLARFGRHFDFAKMR
jgi:hypothetical protein